jgi:hypothetical protein
MDEVPFFFDMSTGYTYHFVGLKEVSSKRTAGSKQRATLVLCALSNGLILPPYIIFKKSTAKDDEVSKSVGKCFVAQNKTGWMSESLMIDWLKKVFFAQPIPVGTRRILIVDSYSVHVRANIKKFVEDRNVKYILIPGGITYLVQPLDVSINKPF